MTLPTVSPKVIYAAIIMALAGLIGGGTQQQLWSDHLLQLLLLPALFFGFTGIKEVEGGWIGKGLVIAIVLLFVIQFFPLPQTLDVKGADGIALQTWLYSAAPGRALESMLFALPLIGFALMIAQFSQTQIKQLALVLIGVFALNLLISVVQYSYGSSQSSSGFLPFEITSGVFANENHFSTLIYSILPFVGYFLFVERKLFPAYVAVIALATLVIFAVGSTSGIVITLLIGALLPLWFMFESRGLAYIYLGVLALGLAATVMFIDSAALQAHSLQMRLGFWQTTLEGLSNHWILGNGIGSFQTVYPAFEKRDALVFAYVNHAHNDWLEILFESGTIGLFIALATVLFLVSRVRKRTIGDAALIAIAVICLHSLVDYPLRTILIGIVFAFSAGAILASSRQERVRVRRSASDAPSRTRVKSSDNDAMRPERQSRG